MLVTAELKMDSFVDIPHLFLYNTAQVERLTISINSA